MNVTQQQKKKMHPAIKFLLWGLGIFILIGVIAVSTGSEKEELKLESTAESVPEEENITSISAAKLQQEYERNEVAADRHYKGKKVRISGRIESIEKDILGDAYIILYAGQFSFGIQCFVKDEDQVAALRKGDIVFVVGTVDGKSLLNVLVNDCNIELP